MRFGARKYCSTDAAQQVPFVAWPVGLLEDRGLRNDDPVVRAERVERRRGADVRRRQRRLVECRHVVRLEERVDQQLPVALPLGALAPVGHEGVVRQAVELVAEAAEPVVDVDRRGAAGPHEDHAVPLRNRPRHEAEIRWVDAVEAVARAGLGEQTTVRDVVHPAVERAHEAELARAVGPRQRCAPVAAHVDVGARPRRRARARRRSGSHRRRAGRDRPGPPGRRSCTRTPVAGGTAAWSPAGVAPSDT